MIPALIGAGASLLGGLINRSSQNEANQVNATAAANNIALQKEFAQSGIQWKVEDAKRAGIHPLYALGANTASFSPVSVGHSADTSLGSAMASAGQDISRSLNATRTQPERDAAFTKTVQDLSITKMGLENELLGSQIAKMRASINPPMPSIGPFVAGEENKPEDRPVLGIGGVRHRTDPGSANAQSFEDRYAEVGSNIAAPMIMWEDLKANYGRPETWPAQLMDYAGRAVSDDFSREYQNLKRFTGRFWPQLLQRR